jgi:hypothetical protein
MHSPHHNRWLSGPAHQAESSESSIDEEDEFLLNSSSNKTKTKEFHDIDPQDLHLIRLISDGSNAFADVWEASCHMKVPPPILVE